MFEDTILGIPQTSAKDYSHSHLILDKIPLMKENP